MLRLETLGGLILTGAGGQQVVPQRRRLALLALLAVAGERGLSRDKLIAVLWPESASDNARHALEQLVYSLRRQLPESPVQGVDPLRLDRAVVETDLDDFARRLGRGELSEALALYRGPFLDGFFVADAPEFERWVDRERARLAGEHARALRTLAEQSEAAGRHTSEIDYWRQLALTDPLGERSATDLVRALAAAGDWVAATRAAREYAARVREELPGVTPADLEALVNRLQRAHRPPGSAATPAESAAPGYTIERELGRGAVATVYLAHDRKLARAVALKLLRPELATATDARRFRREIAILAKLYHPHILQLYDSGVLGPDEALNGLYYVMPYVRGESLRQRLDREGRLPIAEALEFAIQVADALAYAHGEGVVHRDIRPENILLDGGHALLADFGIAGVLERAGGDRLSASGIVLGHAGYISPEQAAAEPTVDGRADIYSLGCVLYEMLGGEPPFTGASRAAVLARQAAGQVPPLRTIRPDVRVSVERAILRSLQRRAEDRFPTADEFRESLRNR